MGFQDKFCGRINTFQKYSQLSLQKRAFCGSIWHRSTAQLLQPMVWRSHYPRSCERKTCWGSVTTLWETLAAITTKLGDGSTITKHGDDLGMVYEMCLPFFSLQWFFYCQIMKVVIKLQWFTTLLTVIMNQTLPLRGEVMVLFFTDGALLIKTRHGCIAWHKRFPFRG